MNNQNTEAVDPSQEVVGYIVNSGLSRQAQAAIRRVQDTLSGAFPGAIWSAPPNSLHVTLMDWLAPLVSYDRDKDALFQSISAQYIKALTGIIEQQPPIKIRFSSIEVHPGAIILRGHDDGSYQRIREQFLDEIVLLPGTKKPPKIVHSTICKFIDDVSLNEVRDALGDSSISFEEEITGFRLVRESQIFMQQYETLHRFPLES